MTQPLNLCFLLSICCCTLVFTSSNNLLGYDSSNFKKVHGQSDSTDSDKNFTDTNSSNMILKKLANKFASRLEDLAEEELGVKIVKEIVDSFEYSTSNNEDAKTAKRLSERLETKLTEQLRVLNRSVSFIQNFKLHSRKLCYVNVPCLYISENGSYEESYNNASLDFNSLPLSILNLTEVFAEAGAGTRSVHYFISHLEPEGLTHVYSDYLGGDKCTIMDDPHFQRVFLKTVSTEQKHVVLLIDNGGSLSENQFAIAKSLVVYHKVTALVDSESFSQVLLTYSSSWTEWTISTSHVVLSLSEQDRISVLAVSDSVVGPCLGAMPLASHPIKHQLLTFIEDLSKSKGSTNHSLAFSVAFKTIEQSVVGEGDRVTVLIVYVSRGLMTSITEARTVMEVISRGQDIVSPSVVINTCVLIDDGKAILYEKHFLSVVAQQNFSMYNISNAKFQAGLIVQGTTVSANSSSNLGAVVRAVCSSPLASSLNSKPVFFLPLWDVTKKGELVVSIAQATIDSDGTLLGVVGVDIPWVDLTEDFLYYNDHGNSYAFLVDIKGYALAHPLLKPPSNFLYEQPVAQDIGHFEISQAFVRVRNVIFQNTSGIWKLTKDQVTFSWQHLSVAPYIVIVKSKGPRRIVRWASASPPPAPVTLAYHRLDLAPSPPRLCRNFRQLASQDTASLFLSTWCFQSPHEYLMSEHNVSQLSVQSYMAYLKDSTKLLANPGLRSGVRPQLISAAPLIPYWKKLYVDSSLTKYIIRKYVVTGSGAVMMYPGGVVDHRLDVLRHSWYHRAAETPGLVTVTPPYLDSAGAGYVITLSIAIGKDPLKFVLAIDFTLGALYHLMVESLPSCSAPLDQAPGNVKCFLMDDRGYLITHPSLIDPQTKGAADEQHHVTHRESLLANDLLNHKGLVEKLVCSDFASNTVQRFYQFNMSLEGVVTNVISGEQCVRYQLTHLPGTNTFLAVVNTTCDLVTAFCPCNTIDRHCLNCNRMEQSECECPCECPLEAGACGQPPTVQEWPPPCPHISEPSLHIPPAVLSLLPSVKPCFPVACDQFPSHKECLGVIGCEWCQLQSDGMSRLSAPFCAHQAYCYNGILGSTGEGPRRGTDGGELRTGVVGLSSVAGVVVALLLALGLMVYCCCNVSARPSHGPSYNAPDSSFYMFSMDKSHHNNMLDEPPTGANQGLVSNAQELSVALLSPAGSVSPYRMSAGYRRPATGDSDHGYSTMTPHEDTEPPPTPTTTHSLPETPPPHHTLLPNPVLAPVTVHMAMEPCS